MRLEVRGNGIRLDRALRDHVERRARFALDRVWGDVREVVVQLTDVNGPRGGVDQRCAVMVWTSDGRALLVREVRETPYAAVSAAMTRMKRRVTERLQRRRARRRGQVLLEQEAA